MKPGNVDAGGAGRRTGRVVTEVAAVRVDDGLGGRQRRMHVREVGGDLLAGQAPRPDVCAFVSGLCLFKFQPRRTGFGTLSSSCFFTAS